MRQKSSCLCSNNLQTDTGIFNARLNANFASLGGGDSVAMLGDCRAMMKVSKRGRYCLEVRNRR
jgi:hypothetical protein